MPATGDVLTLLGAVMAPVFGLIGLGAILGRCGVLTPAGGRDLSQLLYYVALPVQLVVLTARVDVTERFDLRAVGAMLGALVVGMVGAWWASARLPAAERGCVLNGAARGNGAFVGLPVVDLAARALAPEQHAALVGSYAVLLAPSIISFNVGAVIAFRLPHHGVSWSGVRGALAELPRSPLIIAVIIGSTLGAWHPGLLSGTAVGNVLDLLAATAIPLALLSAGQGLDFAHLREHPRTIGLTVLAKLVLVPALAWAIARGCGASPAAVFAVTILMASPAAIASVPMARMLGGDAALMAALVTATTVIAPLTMLGWLLVVGP